LAIPIYYPADNQHGVVALEDLGALPTASEVIAFGFEVSGDRLIAFDATSAGLPGGVATDATPLSADALLLSFDTTVDLGGGLVAADEDFVRWNGSSFPLAFDGSAEGLGTAPDIDAGQVLCAGLLLLACLVKGVYGALSYFLVSKLIFSISVPSEGWM
jgi:hypothetical protein